MDEPKMIPWHRPELQEARQELLLSMAQLEAGEGPEGRTAFERFMVAALKPVGKRAGRAPPGGDGTPQ